MISFSVCATDIIQTLNVIDCRGRHWKGDKIQNATLVILRQQNLFLSRKKITFEHCRKVQARTSLYEGCLNLTDVTVLRSHLCLTPISAQNQRIRFESWCPLLPLQNSIFHFCNFAIFSNFKLNHWCHNKLCLGCLHG